MKPTLSICVLHYNRWDLTKDCLISIDQQEIPCSYEKVLLDNGSSVERSPPLPRDWRLARYRVNDGHIAGQNRCFESAQGEWVLFVANDVRLLPYCVANLWDAHFNLDGTLGQLQPLLLTPTGRTDQCGMVWRWPGYGLSLTRNRSLEVEIVPSTCYLMKKSVWKECGGFDETLRSSHEDVDIGLRLKHSLHLNYVNPYALGVHLGNATLQHQPSHNRAAFHHDRLSVIRKHYHGFDYWIRYLAIQLLDHLPR